MQRKTRIASSIRSHGPALGNGSPGAAARVRARDHHARAARPPAALRIADSEGVGRPEEGGREGSDPRHLRRQRPRRLHLRDTDDELRRRRCAGEGAKQAFSSVPDVTAELFGITNSVDDEIWAARPDLSYTPSSPRLGMQEQSFTHIALLYPYPGQAQAFEAGLKERSALRKKHGADGVDVVQLVIGRDGPAYAVLIGAKDEVDYLTQAAKEQQKMGAEWRASIDKSGPMLRRVEFVTGLARPELYYQP